MTNELLSVLSKYNAGLSYTTDDDGVHIQIDGETVVVLEHSGAVTYR